MVIDTHSILRSLRIEQTLTITILSSSYCTLPISRTLYWTLLLCLKNKWWYLPRQQIDECNYCDWSIAIGITLPIHWYADVQIILETRSRLPWFVVHTVHRYVCLYCADRRKCFFNRYSDRFCCTERNKRSDQKTHIDVVEGIIFFAPQKCLFECSNLESTEASNRLTKQWFHVPDKYQIGYGRNERVIIGDSAESLKHRYLYQSRAIIVVVAIGYWYIASMHHSLSGRIVGNAFTRSLYWPLLLATGLISNKLANIAPVPWPTRVIVFGSPPNLATLSRSHNNAAVWSSSPKLLAASSLVPGLKNPETPN